MKLCKKLGTYFSMLTLVLSGTSLKSIASEGEEGSEAFDDPDAEASESSGEGSSGNSSGSGAAGSGAAGGQDWQLFLFLLWRKSISQRGMESLLVGILFCQVVRSDRKILQ